MDEILVYSDGGGSSSSKANEIRISVMTKGGICIGRKKRVWYPGAIYHVMSRGNHKGDIFRDVEDYQIYLKILERTKERYPFLLCGYCLMTNHVHLQIETTDQELWCIMKNLNFIYAQYFNKKYDLIGHLLQGRYHAEIIEDAAYTLQTSRYIHMNPVKANMVRNPIEYPWSSYDVYMGQRKSDLVSEEKILNYFANNSRELYKEYVENQLSNVTVDEMIKNNLREVE